MNPQRQERIFRRTDVTAADLPDDGTGVTVELDGARVALFRVDGELRACDDSCPHQGASLGSGVVIEGEVACPWHSFHFDLETGLNTDGMGMRIRTFPCRVADDGKVEIGR